MKTVLIILGMLVTLNLASAQSKNFIDQPFIETSAKVDTLITPDRIYMSILISENDTKGKQTVEELERNMLQKLELMGIDLSKQLTLSDLSSNFKKYFLRKQDILKAKSFELLVYDAKTAGQIIYEFEGIGISNVDLDRTEYSGIDELKLELKSLAIKKAKKQAIAMVKPLNQSVGRAIFISDVQSDIVYALQGRAAGIKIRGASTLQQETIESPIEFEKIKVESEVNVKFIID